MYIEHHAMTPKAPNLPASSPANQLLMRLKKFEKIREKRLNNEIRRLFDEDLNPTKIKPDFNTV